MQKTTSHIDVACAIIEKDGKVLTAQRHETMKMPLKWEFPGGKLKPNEDPATCLRREIREELAISIEIINALQPTHWAYPDFTITLYPFICRPGDGTPRATEHRALRWLNPNELSTLDWAEADIPVLDSYISHLKG